MADETTKPGQPVPEKIDERIKRGRERMRSGSSARNEALSFWRNEQYVSRSSTNNLISQATVTEPGGRGKPPHRIRTQRNLIVDIVAHEVSAATQRVPGYEVNPTTADPEDQGAAAIAGKVARYGYDKWKIRNVTTKVVTYATVTGEGFAWPHWDSSVGPYVETGETPLQALKSEVTNKEPEFIGEGEIKVAVFGPNEAYWEPGLDFDESPWHAVEQACTPDSVKDREGYLGGNLRTDARSEEGRVSKKGDVSEAKLVLVTEYLERPCPKYPDGRWLTIANGRMICEPQTYPCTDAQGQVVDEPVLHRLSYFTDPDNDRDMGLVEHLLDAQRTINDCTSKQLEWKNHSLMPRVFIKNGRLVERMDDTPGAVYHIEGASAADAVEIVQIGNVPPELSQIKEEAKEDMARIAAQNDIPSQVESGKGIIALQEKDASRRANFLTNLADFHSRLMRHCLYLVQKHYTERRNLKIISPQEPDLLSDFMGADLKGQADVTVYPGSLEPVSRAAQEERIMIYAQNGWITPEAAMAAINGGHADTLYRSYEQDYNRARQIIQKIKQGPEALFQSPPRLALPQEQVNPLTGEPRVDAFGQPITQVPAWMPRPFDSVPIQKMVLEDWMKTQDYELLPPEGQEAANNVYGALVMLEQQQAAEAQMAQQQMAEGLGMSNAAKPQGPAQTPSQATGSNGASSESY